LWIILLLPVAVAVDLKLAKPAALVVGVLVVIYLGLLYLLLQRPHIQ
jgi:hypothetical protein